MGSSGGGGTNAQGGSTAGGNNLANIGPAISTFGQGNNQIDAFQNTQTYGYTGPNGNINNPSLEQQNGVMFGSFGALPYSYAVEPNQFQIYGANGPITGGGNAGPLQSGGGMWFGTPGQDMNPGPTPGQGGKSSMFSPEPQNKNQVPTGTQGPAGGPNYDPSLGMNAIYAAQNQMPGYMTSGPAPDIVPPPATNTAVNSGMPFAGFSANSPFSLGPYQQLFGGASSPLGTSPYFANAAANPMLGGKGVW